MSKIRNLLNKLKKKKKNSQDLDEIFYDQNDDMSDSDELSDNDHDELDQNIGERTVIFNKENPGDELKPHPTQGEANTPAKSDLQFPKEKKPIQTPPPISDEIKDEATREIQFDHTAPQSPEDLEPIKTELEFEDIDELAEQEVVREIDQEEGFDYTFNNKTFTSEIDLHSDKVTLKDKLEHLGTRIKDRFRNLNKKDLNQAMKPPSQSETKTNIQVAKLKSKVQEVQWNKLIDRILNPQKNQSVHNYFQIFVTLFFIFITANIVGAFLRGQPDYINSGKGSAVIINSEMVLQNSDIDKVRLADVFKTSQKLEQNKPTPQKPQTLAKCTKAESKSSLPIKLHHTIVLQDSVKSIASVSVRSNKVEHIREGDKIKTMAKVDKIDRLELIVRNMQTGLCESIPSSEMKKSDRSSNPIKVMSASDSKNYKRQLKEVKGITNDGNDFTVDREVLKSKMQDINSLLKQARAIKITNPDGTMSFKIVEIEPDSVFTNLGIRDGDIINTIGGEPIQNFNQIMGMFGKITNMNNLKIGVNRDGEAVQQNYTIK